jgi:hypothetical protein
MAFGSRNLGERALHTSETAPSSDQVAAIMGSMYCVQCNVTAFEFERRRGGKYLCLRRCGLWFAGQLDDLVVAGHILLDCQLGWAEICRLYRACHSV